MILIILSIIFFLICLMCGNIHMSEDEIKKENSKYSVAVKEELLRRGYTQTYLDLNRLAVVVFEHPTLYSFSKAFDKKYIIDFGCNCETAIPLDPITYTIYYADGSKEWGVVPDAIMAHNPEGNIESIEHYAENVFKSKTSL